MLVHKETHGVLTYYWDGESYTTFENKRLPKLQSYTFESHDLNPDEWWDIPNSSTLGKRILRCYPYFDSVVKDDMLVGIIPHPSWIVYGEEEPTPIPETPTVVQRGKYNRRKRALL